MHGTNDLCFRQGIHPPIEAVHQVVDGQGSPPIRSYIEANAWVSVIVFPPIIHDWREDILRRRTPGP